MHSLCKKYSSKKRQRVLLIQGGECCCGRTGERTPLVPLQARAGWAKTVNCHAHPRILLPQNRCLPEPLAAPFPHQPEPRCNTLDFASKVVCQRDAAAPLETQRKRPSTALVNLCQGGDSPAHCLDQRNDKRVSHREIAHSFRHPGCPVIWKSVEPFAFDGR